MIAIAVRAPVVTDPCRLEVYARNLIARTQLQGALPEKKREPARAGPVRDGSQPLSHFFLIGTNRPLDSVGVVVVSSVPGVVGALAQNSNRLPKLGVTHSVFHITIIPDGFRFGQTRGGVPERRNPA
ncbi:hypothetical protein [Rhodococcus sp. JVH1]|uniref:hypothetical protein n=1 Tax=Rhodococcus sp. JVH1 TaxID=745408 RepID=UPI0035242DB9